MCPPSVPKALHSKPGSGSCVTTSLHCSVITSTLTQATTRLNVVAACAACSSWPS